MEQKPRQHVRTTLSFSHTLIDLPYAPGSVESSTMPKDLPIPKQTWQSHDS